VGTSAEKLVGVLQTLRNVWLEASGDRGPDFIGAFVNVSQKLIQDEQGCFF
jgi:hypothetical protein